MVASKLVQLKNDDVNKW